MSERLRSLNTFLHERLEAVPSLKNAGFLGEDPQCTEGQKPGLCVVAFTSRGASVFDLPCSCQQKEVEGPARACNATPWKQKLAAKTPDSQSRVSFLLRAAPQQD